jgi:hypothetical protein
VRAWVIASGVWALDPWEIVVIPASIAAPNATDTHVPFLVIPRAMTVLLG